MKKIILGCALATSVSLAPCLATAAELDTDSVQLSFRRESFPFGDFCFANVRFKARSNGDGLERVTAFLLDNVGTSTSSSVGRSVSGSSRFITISGEFLFRGAGPFTLKIFETASFVSAVPPPESAKLFEYEIPEEDILGAGSACTDFGNVSLNTAPVADAGEDITGAIPNKLIYLDGTNSSDADFDELSYNWRQISGPIVDLLDANSELPSFQYPPGRADQTLEFELTVYDGTESSEPDTVKVIHNGRSNGNRK